MSRKKTLVGIGLIVAIMALTGWMLFKDQPITRLLQILGRLKPGWLVLGLGLMLVFVGCEALCSHLILGRLGHRAPYRHCLGYSFVGFYVSSITPSATGGQPAQVYYMSKDGIPAAHGALNMMLIAVCYQVVVMGYALAIVLLRFDLVTNLGTGLGLLLLFGAAVNGVLTAGMLCLMFLPNAARKLTGWVLSLLVRVRLVRNEAAAREKLEKQMEEYRRGGRVRQAEPRPGARPAGRHLLPAHRPVRRAPGGVPRLRPQRQRRHGHHRHPGPGHPGGGLPPPARSGGRLRGRLCGRHEALLRCGAGGPGGAGLPGHQLLRFPPDQRGRHPDSPPAHPEKPGHRGLPPPP